MTTVDIHKLQAAIKIPVLTHLDRLVECEFHGPPLSYKGAEWFEFKKGLQELLANPFYAGGRLKKLLDETEKDIPLIREALFSEKDIPLTREGLFSGTLVPKDPVTFFLAYLLMTLAFFADEPIGESFFVTLYPTFYPSQTWETTFSGTCKSGGILQIL